MDKLMNQIVEKFASRVSEISSVPVDEVMSIWNQVISSIKIEFDQEQSSSSKPQTEASNEAPAKEKKSSKSKATSNATSKASKEKEPAAGEDKKCCYKAKKGKTAGVECGKKVTGKNMCSAHKKYENDIVDEVPTDEVPAEEVPADEVPAEEVPAKTQTQEETKCQYLFTKGANKNKTCDMKTKNEKFCAKHSKSSETIPTKEMKVPKRAEAQTIPTVLELKKDKNINRLVNRQTGLIFKSETESKVIVGILRNGILAEITDADKVNVKQFVEKFNLSYEKDNALSELKKKEIEDILEEMIEEEDAEEADADAEVDAEVDLEDPDYMPDEEELEEEGDD
jgi:hypothetical protein